MGVGGVTEGEGGCPTPEFDQWWENHSWGPSVYFGAANDSWDTWGTGGPSVDADSASYYVYGASEVWTTVSPEGAPVYAVEVDGHECPHCGNSDQHDTNVVYWMGGMGGMQGMARKWTHVLRETNARCVNNSGIGAMNARERRHPYQARGGRGMGAQAKLFQPRVKDHAGGKVGAKEKAKGREEKEKGKEENVAKGEKGKR